MDDKKEKYLQHLREKTRMAQYKGGRKSRVNHTIDTSYNLNQCSNKIDRRINMSYGLSFRCVLYHKEDGISIACIITYNPEQPHVYLEQKSITSSAHNTLRQNKKSSTAFCSVSLNFPTSKLLRSLRYVSFRDSKMIPS